MNAKTIPLPIRQRFCQTNVGAWVRKGTPNIDDVASLYWMEVGQSHLGQGRDPTRPAEVHLCSQPTRGWSHACRLQHPRVNPSFGPPSLCWHVDFCENPDRQNINLKVESFHTIDMSRLRSRTRRGVPPDQQRQIF
ncbi:hypothetical protein WN944_001854 [Citrus x changshan-huyou]|uniref:Uncharacterized protein n=1 Tax=Citrus x changshan-huyou TaxID=2935761 RepID=A0AAP0QV81_9ROSI